MKKYTCRKITSVVMAAVMMLGFFGIIQGTSSVSAAILYSDFEDDFTDPNVYGEWITTDIKANTTLGAHTVVDSGSDHYMATPVKPTRSSTIDTMTHIDPDSALLPEGLIQRLEFQFKQSDYSGAGDPNDFFIPVYWDMDTNACVSVKFGTTGNNRIIMMSPSQQGAYTVTNAGTTMTAATSPAILHYATTGNGGGINVNFQPTDPAKWSRGCRMKMVVDYIYEFTDVGGSLPSGTKTFAGTEKAGSPGEYENRYLKLIIKVFDESADVAGTPGYQHTGYYRLPDGVGSTPTFGFSDAVDGYLIDYVKATYGREATPQDSAAAFLSSFADVFSADPRDISSGRLIAMKTAHDLLEPAVKALLPAIVEAKAELLKDLINPTTTAYVDDFTNAAISAQYWQTDGYISTPRTWFTNNGSWDWGLYESKFDTPQPGGNYISSRARAPFESSKIPGNRLIESVTYDFETGNSWAPMRILLFKQDAAPWNTSNYFALSVAPIPGKDENNNDTKENRIRVDIAGLFGAGITVEKQVGAGNPEIITAGSGDILLGVEEANPSVAIDYGLNKKYTLRADYEYTKNSSGLITAVEIKLYLSVEGINNGEMQYVYRFKFTKTSDIFAGLNGNYNPCIPYVYSMWYNYSGTIGASGYNSFKINDFRLDYTKLPGEQWGNFLTAYDDVLALDENTASFENLADIQKALAAYDRLPDNVKLVLAPEKAALDALMLLDIIPYSNIINAFKKSLLKQTLDANELQLLDDYDYMYTDLDIIGLLCIKELSL